MSGTLLPGRVSSADRLNALHLAPPAAKPKPTKRRHAAVQSDGSSSSVADLPSHTDDEQPMTTASELHSSAAQQCQRVGACGHARSFKEQLGSTV